MADERDGSQLAEPQHGAPVSEQHRIESFVVLMVRRRNHGAARRESLLRGRSAQLIGCAAHRVEERTFSLDGNFPIGSQGPISD